MSAEPNSSAPRGEPPARWKELIRRLLPRGLRQHLYRWRLRHEYRVVRAGNGAFAIFGDPEWQPHLERVYLGDAGPVRVHRGLYAANMEALVEQLMRRHGLVLVSGLELPARLAAAALRVPRFVALTVELGESEAAFYKRVPHAARSDIKRTARMGFVAEVHANADWSREFVERFHEQGIMRRHGAEGFVMGAADVASLVREHGHEFVCVTRDGRRLAAVVAERQPDAYRMGRCGWLDGNPELVREGVLGAMYWFTMQRARALGLSRVRMGGTPAYIEDGVFQYKMKWTARLDRSDTRFGTHFLLLDPAHPRVQAYLGQRSLIALDEQDRFVVYSARRPGELRLSDEVRSGLAGWYCVDPAVGRFVQVPLERTESG